MPAIRLRGAHHLQGEADRTLAAGVSGSAWRSIPAPRGPGPSPGPTGTSSSTCGGRWNCSFLQRSGHECTAEHCGVSDYRQSRTRDRDPSPIGRFGPDRAKVHPLFNAASHRGGVSPSWRVILPAFEEALESCEARPGGAQKRTRGVLCHAWMMSCNRSSWRHFIHAVKILIFAMFRKKNRRDGKSKVLAWWRTYAGVGVVRPFFEPVGVDHGMLLERRGRDAHLHPKRVSTRAVLLHVQVV